MGPLATFTSAILLAMLIAVASPAAPPTVTTLTPPGAARGTAITLTAIGTFDTWPVKVWSSSPGVVVKADKDKGQFAIKVSAQTPLGMTWLRFHDATGTSPLRPFIVGGLPDVRENEPNDERNTAQPVTMPAVVNGTLGKTGDVECYAVKVAKGQTLVASLVAHQTLRSPMDSILQLLSVDGVVLRQNHDTRGLDPEIVYTAPADATYIVRLFAFPAQPDSSIRYFGSPACVYRLTLTVGEFLDFVTPLAVEQGRETPVTLHGWNLESPTRLLGSEIQYLGTARPFAIMREPHPCFDLYAPNTEPLSPPFTVTGRVTKAGATSKILIATTAGQPLSIRLDSETLGLALTPVLKMFDPTDKELLRAEPALLHGPLVTSFNPKVTGTVRLEVQDLLQSASTRHLYRLKVMPAAAEIEAKLASDRWTMTAGTPLDISITLSRKSEFPGEMIPFVEGLPDGVTSETVPPAKKSDSTTVILRLTAKTAGVSAPIRIGVTKKEDKSFRRFASAPLADTDATTTDHWITVAEPTRPGK